MSGHLPNLADRDLTPPPTWSQSSVAFTSRTTSIADDSDAEFDPTPLQSPRGGPDYNDLPPSYDEAQTDARNGVTPLDPNQIEAHRLTLNEGPDEPEIWEYRIRGEQLDDAELHEDAPEYDNITNEMGTNVPVRHVQNTETIPVGRTGTGTRTPTSNTPHISIENLLARAFTFTQHEADADVQYAPRLSRRIVIPPQSSGHNPQEGDRDGPSQFLRAYAKALHAHSIRPAEFTEFLDGLNALMTASGSSMTKLLRPESDSIVHDYLRGANEGFFAPRGLRVSLQSVSALMASLNIPTNRGQRDGAVASVLDHSASAEMKAMALHPWIEPLETMVPAQSSQSLMLLEMAERLRLQTSTASAASPGSEARRRSELEDDDPPHSIPEADYSHAGPPHDRSHGRGRGGHRGGSWSPFGTPGYGPFGLPGSGPFGRPGRRPFGGRGRGRGNFGPSSRGARGPPPLGRNRATEQRAGSNASQPANEWENLGQSLGRWGEEFGKRMGEWGQQFGKQAETWGQDVEKRAEVWGEEVSARASGSGSRRRSANAPAQPDDTLPPSYHEGPSGQESGVLRGDSKGYGGPPGYTDISRPGEPTNSAEVHKEDDESSLSSDSSSDSDSDSESESDDDDDDVPDTQAKFLKRIASINRQAEDATRKGKKSPDEIAHEREHAIEKTDMELKIEARMAKRVARREHRQKCRDLKREHRHKKRALKVAYMSKGKGKGKAKKTSEWKQNKKEYREKKKALRKEKSEARKTWRDARSARRNGASGGANTASIGSETLEKMAWVVIDNLDA